MHKRRFEHTQMWLAFMYCVLALRLPHPCAYQHTHAAQPARATRYLRCAAIDPFRPTRPPIEPMIINAVQSLLAGSAPAVEVAATAIEARAADPDYSLTTEEQALFTQRLLRIEKAKEALTTLLESIVTLTPWINKFKAAPSFGIGAASDPLARLCRAECMLALIILHVEGGRVDFVDEDRLEVLRDSPTPQDVEMLRAAAAASSVNV